MRSSLLIFLLSPLAASAQIESTARQTIERTIVAHGGADKLSRVKADRVKVQGQLYVGDAKVPYTAETTIRPGRLHLVMTLREKGRDTVIEHVLDQDKATVRVNGEVRNVSAAHTEQMRQTLRLDEALKLVPLLGAGYVLEPLGEFAYGSRVVVGVGVLGRGQRGVKLYFDKQSALLIKSEHLIDGPGGKALKQEAFYGDYREVGGRLRPGSIGARRDGKRALEATLVEAVALPEAR